MRKPLRIKEDWVKLQIKKILRKYGVYWYMAPGGLHGVAGTPDFLCCVHGTFLAIEAKVVGNKPTDIQNIQIAKIKKAGGIAVVIHQDNLDKLEVLIQRIIDASQKRRVADGSRQPGPDSTSHT